MKVGVFEVKEVNKDEITGRVEYWKVDSTSFDGYTVIRGFVYDDKRQRFKDGESLRSSALVGDAFDSLKEGDLVRTLNSRYLLGKPLPQKDH